MSKSLENARQKQSAIVQAALDLFLQQGYTATRMDSVADLAGVTKQTVYRYYPSKGELFSAAMERIRADEPRLYQFGEGPLERELTGFGRDLLAFHLSPAALGIYRIILREGGEADSPLKPFMQSGPTRVIEYLAAFLKQRCPALDDATFHAQMFVGMILTPRNQLVIQGRKRISRSEQENHVAKVVRLFLNGLQPEPDSTD